VGNEIERIKLTHATTLEEYRALRAEYNQNTAIINGLLATFYTGLGTLVAVVNAQGVHIAPNGLALIGVILNCLGFAQLHFLRTNLSLIECLTRVQFRLHQLLYLLEPAAEGQVLRERLDSWEYCYLSQVGEDKITGIPVIISRYAMPYAAGLVCTIFALGAAASYPQESYPLMWWAPPLEAYFLFMVVLWARRYFQVLSKVTGMYQQLSSTLHA